MAVRPAPPPPTVRAGFPHTAVRPTSRARPRGRSRWLPWAPPRRETMLAIKWSPPSERPLGMTADALMARPPGDASEDEAVEVPQGPRLRQPEVLTGAADVHAQLENEVLQGQVGPASDVAERVSDSSLRLVGDVERNTSVRSPTDFVTQEVDPFFANVNDSRLLRVQRQPQPLHQVGR